MRLLGRARALEVMLSAEDYDAELAERYGWINRALAADDIAEFPPTASVVPISTSLRSGILELPSRRPATR